MRAPEEIEAFCPVNELPLYLGPKDIATWLDIPLMDAKSFIRDHSSAKRTDSREQFVTKDRLYGIVEEGCISREPRYNPVYLARAKGVEDGVRGVRVTCPYPDGHLAMEWRRLYTRTRNMVKKGELDCER